MKNKLRVLGLVTVVAAVAGVAALAIPGSPIYLPDFLIRDGVYEQRPTRYWVAALDSANAAERLEALKAVASIGPEKAGQAVPKLGAILTNDPDANVRNEAALALSKMAPASREVLPSLIKAIDDKEAPVRVNTMMALARLKTDARSAIPALVKALNDDANLTNAQLFHHSIQELAAMAIGHASAGTQEGLPHLTEFLKRSKTSMMKEAAVRAIGYVGPEARSAEPLLIPFLKDRNKQVREATAEALQRLGAPVPKVEPPPPEGPPPGVDPQNRFPGRPPGVRPGGQPNSRPADDPKKNDDKAKPMPEDKGKGDPDDSELAAAEREYLWQIEHHGNVLTRYGFGPLAAALTKANPDALRRLLADDFASADIEPSERVAVNTDFATVERQHGSGPPRRLNRDEFVARLLEARKRFPATAPTVKLALMELAPKVRGHLDGLWGGTAQLRLHGEHGPGAPAEVVLRFRYEVPRPTEAGLARAGWLRRAELLQIQTAKAPRYLFAEVARQRGLDASRLHDNWTGKSFQPISGGAYVCDFDRDGFLDVLITDLNGTAFYRGRPGGMFVDVTDQCGLPRRGRPGATAWIDIDSDGWDDLVLAGRVWRNDGGRGFVDYTRRCELRLPHDAINIAVADYDRDGRLDLYATRAGHPGSGSWLEGTMDDPDGNHLFRNEGGWKFQDVTRAANAGGGRRSSFTAAWLDADNDGWPDLHVINELGDGVLLVNNRDGTFREQALADQPADFGSMGLAVGDIDNDGRIDIYCANMYSKAGTRVIGNLAPDAYSAPVMSKLRRFVAGSELHLNRGGLRFEQAGARLQVNSVGWAYGAALADLDNDGFLDVYATAGFISRDRDQPDG